MEVCRLAVAPVKGMSLQHRDELALGAGGVAGDRRFYLVDADGRMVNGKQIGELLSIAPDFDDARRRLSLRFPDGVIATSTIEPGPLIETRFYSGDARAMVVPGPLSDAISAFVGRSLRLVEADPAEGGVDRGRRGGVSLVSRASLQRFAAEAGIDGVDARRFRMTIEIDGADAFAEDGWLGRRVRCGDAVVRVGGHVGRCLVTSRDPDSGEIDLPTLDVLGSYRRGAATTEPLALGVYGEVVEPGVVRVGDPVALERAAT